MIKDNKHTGWFRPKYGYDIDENDYPILLDLLIMCMLGYTKHFDKQLIEILIF